VNRGLVFLLLASIFLAGVINAVKADVVVEAYYDTLLIAADEEFQQIAYWIPPDAYLGWKDAAENIVERADDPLWKLFRLDLRIAGFVTWDSDDTVLDGEGMLLEALKETGFVSGEVADILVAFTLQGMEVAGATLPNKNAVIIEPSEKYWPDDNLLQHEISHVFYARDHEDGSDPSYYEECVMSYRPVWTETVSEDGWIFIIYDHVAQAFLTEDYCQECFVTLKEYIPLKGHRFTYVVYRWGGGGGRWIFVRK